MVRLRKKTHVGLSIFAIMVRNTNLVEQTVKLVDNGIDLLRQVTGVHFGRFHGVRHSGRACANDGPDVYLVMRL